jgi:hypothetical protein
LGLYIERLIDYHITMTRWSRWLVYLLPGALAATGAVLGLLSGGEVTLVVGVLTVLLVGLSVAVPPVVERLGVRTQEFARVHGRRARQMREHFEPRGRGVLPTQLREGSYFTGRTAVLSDLASWLHHQGDGRRCLVLTGSPGSGKSAVLVRLMTQYPRLMIVAVHGRGRQVDEVADEIAVGLGCCRAGRAACSPHCGRPTPTG